MTVKMEQEKFDRAKAFKRTALMVGDEGLERLQHARVSVVGLGAVGSFAVEALARSGIGMLNLFDFDVIHCTNLNRQLFATIHTMGQTKSQAAQERVLSINPECRVAATELFVNQESVDRAFDPVPDIIIDAIDSVNPKANVMQYAYEHAIPIISCMGAATRSDPSFIRVADISKTNNCPLSRFIRKRLGRRNIRKGIRCVFSCEPINRSVVSDETDLSDEELRVDLGQGRPRNTLGSYCSIPGIFGLIAAQEVINFLLNKEIEPHV